jgi:hypothetical protein
MKATCLMVVFASVGAFGQTTTTVKYSAVAPPLYVVGLPYSADEVEKSTWKLPDGTTASPTETRAFYRDSAGRTRVEQPKESPKAS